MKNCIVLPMVLLAGAAAAKDVQLPPNVTVRPSGYGNNHYIDTLSIEAKPATFSKLKLCLAQNVSNPALMITGGTDAPFTFIPSNKTQTNTIQGGEIFKYQDEAERTAIVLGSVPGRRTLMSRNLIRFELTAIASDAATSLKFTNIEHATENTGAVANSGFLPVGAWSGAKPLTVIEALQDVAQRVDSCLR